jgi:integrase
MAARRDRGSGSVTFEHDQPCTDARHRSCQGRWRGVISLGYDTEGKRIRRKVSGLTKAAVLDRMAALRGDIDGGIKPAPANYNLARAADDWLKGGLPGRDAATVRKNRAMLAPVLAVIGGKRLRELTAGDVERALRGMTGTHSTASIYLAHNALVRTIRHAAARDLVARNVAELAGVPDGRPGRPSKALSLHQVALLLKAAGDTRMHAYIALCAGTAIRTEEARALRWDHVDLDGDPDADPPVPPSVAVWRSVRRRGDVKTPKSRRTLRLPQLAVDALREHQQREGRADGLVFATKSGRAMDAGSVRKEFRRVVKAAGLEDEWTPRELRHTAVSLLSLGGVPVEEIARIAGHSSTSVTEMVYRRELRPVITGGAQAIDTLLG